jgi:hypothetical protein
LKSMIHPWRFGGLLLQAICVPDIFDAWVPYHLEDRSSCKINSGTP